MQWLVEHNGHSRNGTMQGHLLLQSPDPGAMRIVSDKQWQLYTSKGPPSFVTADRHYINTSQAAVQIDSNAPNSPTHEPIHYTNQSTTQPKNIGMATFNAYHSAPGYSLGHPSMPTPIPNASGEPRLMFFIIRNNGLPIPLVPVDELPFNLESVPRVLSPAQTYGMHYVGNAGYSGATFKIQNDGYGMQRSTSQPGSDAAHYRYHSADSTKQFQAPDALARQAFANSASANTNMAASSMPKRPLSASQAAVSWRRSDQPLASNSSASEATQNAINAILRSEAGAETAERIGYRTRDDAPPPSGIIPDQDKKVYCTFWILNGTCAYAQQGCRYKHEMPDKAKLAEIGIKHVPQWWKEENATFKMGPGKTASAGPIMKPEEWLNARKGSDADSEHSSTSSGSDATTLTSQSEKAVEIVKKEKEMPAKKDKATPVILKRAPQEDKNKKTVETKAEPSKDTDKKSCTGSSPIIPPARPPNPADRVRKMSTGSDLINFAPLQPTPSPPAETSKRITADAITTKARELSNGKTMKVFVPAGESPEAHIADAKKRERAVRNKSPAQRGKTCDKQAKEMQKSKSEGLGASRWASVVGKTEEQGKRVRAGTCRPRHPASASPAAKGKVAEGTEKK